MTSLIHGYEALELLNTEQKEAVKHTEGPLLVLAGAGTGKTSVLTYRIAHIIKSDLALPGNILAVTFTNKAAREMQERITRLIPCTGAYLGTFHSVAAKILRQYAELLGLSSSFTIIDSDDQTKLITTLLKEKDIDVKTYTPKSVLNTISRWKDSGFTPDKLSTSEVKNTLHHIAEDVYHKYQNRLLQSNAVDFGDLLLYNNILFIQNPDILRLHQQRFKYILIDEYQDTNAVQYTWAKMLTGIHNNLCCVGDDDQSIYGWRGAEIGNILRFEKDFPNAKVIKLERNYRSSRPILEAAHGVIQNNQNRHSKKLWTDGADGEMIKIVSCWNDREEARYVTAEIGKFIKDAKDVAVLVRAGFQTRAFEEAFVSSAVPYAIVGGMKFYDRMEIKDALAYIRSTLNNNDDLAFERIINVPRRGIGDVTIDAIKAYARHHNISIMMAVRSMLDEGLLKNKISEALHTLLSQFDKWKLAYSSLPPDKVTKDILEESGYLSALKLEKTEESRERIDNLHEMLRAISEYSTIEAFTEHTSLVTDVDGMSDHANTVKLMTLHAAKGLEFTAVFLPGWEEGVFPNSRALDEDGKKGLEEERRIAYVGITRAKKYLYITHANTRRIFHEYVQSIPSRFISEIPENVSTRISSTEALVERPTIKARKPQSHSDSSDPWRPGKRVDHSAFGRGIIVRKNDDNLEIAFDKIGLKTIKQDFLTLVT